MPTRDTVLATLEAALDAYVRVVENDQKNHAGAFALVPPLSLLRHSKPVIETSAALNDHSQRIEEMQRRLRVSQSRIQSHMNAIQPIGSLSPELLSFIFQLAVTPPHSKAYNGNVDNSYRITLLAITKVSSFWRAVALEHSALWTTVHLGWPKCAVQNWIHRSIARPLNVSIRIRRANGAIGEPGGWIIDDSHGHSWEQDDYTALAAHSGRWKTARFRITESASEPSRGNSFFPVLMDTISMPALESLELVPLTGE